MAQNNAPTNSQPAPGNATQNAILTTSQPQMNPWCAELYWGYQKLADLAEKDLALAGVTFFSIGPPEVLAATSGVLGTSAMVEHVAFNGFCK